MRKRKILLLLILIILMVIAGLSYFEKGLNTAEQVKLVNRADYAGEKIIYAVSPLAGEAQYSDLGPAELDGKSAELATFRTKVIGFDDTEKIYTNAETFFPLKVERDIKFMLGAEFIVEDYNPQKCAYTIKKFKGKKLVEEKEFSAEGPIHNAIILPFSLRAVPELEVGFSLTFWLPLKFEVKLVNIEEVKVPAGKFSAYHFTSEPNRFEIWISDDERRIPIKIQGAGMFGYTLSMKKYIPPDAKKQE